MRHWSLRFMLGRALAPLLSLFLGALLTLALYLPVTAYADEHHTEPLDLDGLMDAFGWDMDNAVIRAEKLSEGFYVLFGIGGNIGVSIGEQGTLIVDDQFPQVMPKINKAIENLGGDKVDFAINTHWHFDHAEGNLALGPAGTWIVAHEESRKMMFDDHIINLVALTYNQTAYPEDARPVITYTDKMMFHFNGEQIDLLHFGPAHTTGDTAIYFRGTNAVHLGDVFNRGYPFIDADNGGDLDGMIKFCQQVHDVINDDTKVIPGHGEVSDRAGLAHYIKMLQTMRDSIGAMVVAGTSLEEVIASAPTAAYDEEFGDPANFVNRAYASLSKTHAAAQKVQAEADAAAAAAKAASVTEVVTDAAADAVTSGVEKIEQGVKTAVDKAKSK